MKKYLIIGIILLAFVSVGTFACLRDKKPVEGLYASERATVVTDCQLTDRQIIDEVNKYRAELGVAPLSFNSLLDTFADKRALDMDGTMDSHSGLNSASQAFENMGYKLIGENQKYVVMRASTGYNCLTDAVYDFKASEKHWTSLMNPRYDEIGVGFYKKVLNINLGDLR